MSRLIDFNTTDGVGFGNVDETDAPLNVAGEFNVAGTLNLDQALGISGVVLDDSQSPIQDATIAVTLTENGQDVIYDTTDVNGEYAFTEHPDGDNTKKEWHVTAAKNDVGDLFNAESKPFVRATLTPTIIQATGGDVVQDVTLNGIDYRIHAFTTVGTQTFEVTNAPSQNDTVDVLVVAGGGGGGGLGYANNIAVKPGDTFTVVVGAGGTGDGSNSSFGSEAQLVAFGGSSPTGDGTGNGGGGQSGSLLSGGGNGGKGSIYNDFDEGAGGGGAGGHYVSGSNKPGASGGSGTVILRYPNTYTISVGAGLTSSTTTDGSDKITTFTAGTDTISFS